ncbi:MAG TPA: AAA family ATPase [Bacteroidales bacterium]|nr:MAG: AAA family ATPase [Bacteroidetes bacterium GWF2_33_38]OFY86257.1 MAG: AAA family ATPase [Bacteroidetes bacterium RIFOXYA2_FULL_33_7]HBF88208.1 AAA family ATPase [Bacteroidales bacterium]
MTKTISITCVNNNYEKVKFPAGVSLKEILKTVKPTLKYPVLGALVNNELQELSYEMFKPKHVKFIDITSSMGIRMYVRSLSFILIKAFNERFPNATLKIANSISKGLYCEIEGLDGVIYAEDVEKIKTRMHEIVKADIPFKREEMVNDEALKIYEKNNQPDKCKLFKDRKILYTSVYYIDETVDYFYEYLVPSTSYITNFDLVKYHEGLLLRFPKVSKPEELEDIVKEDKLFEIFKEHKHWAKILGVENVGSLNQLTSSKKVGDLVKISEALHEKKIARIADDIHTKSDKVKLVLISGPSSSGKTSFCKRLSIQLQVLGFQTMLISLDDYFVNREFTPLDENGEYDFECLEAIDVKQFNTDMLALMDGKEVEIPKFDFTTGQRTYLGNKKKVCKNTLFIVEGIHGLNPGLTPDINEDFKYKVYVSALTQISIDNHNRIPTTDNRLIRRMVRDYKYRGYSALATIKRWPSVRKGEELNIFPFQENADAVFNSALLYEIAILKRRAVPILNEVPQSADEYSEAIRLLKFLSYFNDIPEEMEKEIPPTSIIREFLGGSSFKY